MGGKGWVEGGKRVCDSVGTGRRPVRVASKWELSTFRDGRLGEASLPKLERFPVCGEAFELFGVFLELAEEFGHPGFDGMNFLHQLKMALEAGNRSMGNHARRIGGSGGLTRANGKVQRNVTLFRARAKRMRMRIR